MYKLLWCPKVYKIYHLGKSLKSEVLKIFLIYYILWIACTTVTAHPYVDNHG